MSDVTQDKTKEDQFNKKSSLCNVMTMYLQMFSMEDEFATKSLNFSQLW